jgi:hypothetical protein
VCQCRLSNFPCRRRYFYYYYDVVNDIITKGNVGILSDIQKHICKTTLALKCTLKSLFLMLDRDFVLNILLFNIYASISMKCVLINAQFC